MSVRLSNISLKTYRNFLIHIGCKCNRIEGGHEHWSRTDLRRPLTLQSHIDPVPEFIVKQHLRYLNISRQEFVRIIEGL